MSFDRRFLASGGAAAVFPADGAFAGILNGRPTAADALCA